MEPSQLPWVYWLCTGQLVGMGTMFVGAKASDYYEKKKSEKMADGLMDMAEDIDEEELNL